ncbi:MAG TPA: iron-containing alcohol dehydrogenase [Candidatus Dormibacteraeota bacterium]|nr:iron-containing alcohol dehydrogenase [Candidatus Dormibacteraeota bacterium]
MNGVFSYSNPSVIHWGPGSVSQLAPELVRFGVGRVALVTARSLLANEQLVGEVRQALGEVEAPVTVVIGQHSPVAEIEEAANRAAEAEVDGMVSLGGGSAIDAAKIVSVMIADRRGLQDRALMHVAIPTTLSVAELGLGAGYTDQDGDKAGVRDPRLLCDCVIYDSKLTLATPMALWLATGIRAVDHAVEGYLASGFHQFSDVMAVESLRRLFVSLPKALVSPADLEVRTENQLAAWFSYTLPTQSAGGLSHLMSKQIGARHHIPHGVSSCLLLPHVMRYLARKGPQRMQLLSEAMGWGTNPLTPADKVQGLIAALGLPQHIADYKLGEAEVRRAADDLAGRYPAADILAIYKAAM